MKVKTGTQYSVNTLICASSVEHDHVLCTKYLKHKQIQNTYISFAVGSFGAFPHITHSPDICFWKTHLIVQYGDSILL